MARLRFALPLLLALLVAPLGRAEAAPISFGFSLAFFDGPLVGQSFAGTLSVDGDDCAGPCNGIFAPLGASGNLLSFDVTVDGTNFHITDDLDYPIGPEVGFVNDVVTSVNFSDGHLVINVLDVGYLSARDELSRGTFVPGKRLAVPESGTLALLGLGLAGLVAARRRRQ